MCVCVCVFRSDYDNAFIFTTVCAIGIVTLPFDDGNDS